MSYLALYRKYRPIDFDSVYGQNDTVTVLKNAIINGKISHAYLFSGPRGTGKTTIAKIIARIVNCENIENGNACGKCYNCRNFLNSNDIVEIDAASNNGVDEIRELRDKINLVPSNSKYKVYIIDEVHMLTNQAFNALLKTLEEPPEHVIFILATTEPHKIPLTISSRCQKFSFSKISDEEIVDRLKFIAKSENIIVDNDSLYEIARISDGGMRDAINFLDQLASYNNSTITIQNIYDVNGSISYDNIYNLLLYIKQNDKTNIIYFIENINKNGCDIKKFIEELIVFLKDVIVFISTNKLSNVEVKNNNIKKVAGLYNLLDIYDLIEYLNNQFGNIIYSTHSQIIFMTILLKYSSKYQKEEKKQENIVHDNDDKIISREIISDGEKNISQKENSKNSKVKFDVEIRINNALATASKQKLINYKKKWVKIGEYISNEEFSIITGLLVDTQIVVASDNYVILTNDLESICERININSDKVEKLFKEIFESDVNIVAVSSDYWNDKKKEYISNIKKGIKYIIIEEKKDNENNTNIDSSVGKLLNIIGDDLIDYK